MKKEYHFTISRTDRVYLVVFVTLLLGWELIKYIMPSSHIEIEWKAAQEKYERKTPYTRQDYKSGYPKRKEFTKPTYPKQTKDFSNDEMLSPTPVAIMDASVEQLRAIGISSKVASNIKKYISAGGVLKNEEDVLKIYGMDQAQWDRASSYIIFTNQTSDLDNTSKWPKKN
jgi:hypothetical protein